MALPEPALAGGGGGAATIATPRHARDDLRRQIATLERRLAALFASAFPRHGIEWRVGAAGGPRVLDVEDLERVRDALVVRLRDAQAEISRRAEAEEANRGLLEAMIAEPERHRWLRISNEDLGENGCRHWHARPRWGVLGMLLGWWRVKLSSGCPLAEGGGPSSVEQAQASQGRPATPPAAPGSRGVGTASGRGQASGRPRRAPAGALGLVSPGGARDVHRPRPPRARVLRR
jgi:hypothetical protein